MSAFPSKKLLHSLVLATALSVPGTAHQFSRDQGEDILKKEGKNLQNSSDTLKKTLDAFVELRTIVSGDFPAKLAQGSGLTLAEFIDLNKFYASPGFSATPLILRKGESYVFPKNSEEIKRYLSHTTRLTTIKKIHKALESGSISEITSLDNEPFFPVEPGCMGLPQMLALLLSMQAREYDPELPVFVDQRNEKTASCANLIRQTYLQSCGLKSYTEAQKTMLLTPDLHAWILIRELRDTFGYEQSHADLMNYFDLSAFHSFMPIQSSKRKAYDKRVLDLYRFLHDAAQPGTIVPMYFQGSQSKGLVMKAYRQNDPHLNTHQTMFAGNMDWSVRVQDIPQIIDGKRMPAREESPQRNLIDTLIDFIADRADFRSSFLPQFRQTVLQGLVRYPEMIHLEVRGEKINIAQELQRYIKGDPQQIRISSKDAIVFVNTPMMLDGEIRSTSDKSEQRERMNARMRFFFEFLMTIYLPTEVLSPKGDTLPKQDETLPVFARKYLYSLRPGDSLASVLKRRIATYEEIDEAAESGKKLLQEHFTWQMRGLKIDGYIQSENILNPGTTNINRIIPYYNVGEIKISWKQYLGKMKHQQKILETSVPAPFLRIDIRDGAGLDSKKKIFLEILEKIEIHQEKYPSFQYLKTFNSLQYEIFMNAFFQYSSNTTPQASTSREFYTNIRPNTFFYITHSGLSNIIENIYFAPHLFTPSLRPLDSEVIDAIISNPTNAALIKNILVVESYPTKEGTGVRRLLKQVGGRSKGDFQIRLTHLHENIVFIEKNRLYFLGKNENKQLVEWPNLTVLRQAVDTIFNDQIRSLALKHLSKSSLKQFQADMVLFDEIRKQLHKETLSSEEFHQILTRLNSLIRLDSGKGDNLAGKIFSTVILDAKISLHYQKITYWLEKMGGSPEEILAIPGGKEIFERMVALVNNSSEDKVLLALLENRILRILQQGFQFQIPTKDVYARPSGIVKKAYQKVSNQLYYDREVFLKHFREYIELAESTLKTQEAILRVGVAMASPEIIAERRSMIEHLKVYLYRFSSTKQFNEDIFAFFQDPILSKNIPSFPFPTDSEANTGAFARSIFHYSNKIKNQNQ